MRALLLVGKSDRFLLCIVSQVIEQTDICIQQKEQNVSHPSISMCLSYFFFFYRLLDALIMQNWNRALSSHAHFPNTCSAAAAQLSSLGVRMKKKKLLTGAPFQLKFLAQFQLFVMFKYIKECHYWEILSLCMISIPIRVKVCVFCVPTSCLCCHTPADEEERLSGWCKWNLPGSCQHKPQVCPSPGCRHGPGKASIHVKHQSFEMLNYVNLQMQNHEMCKPGVWHTETWSFWGFDVSV